MEVAYGVRPQNPAIQAGLKRLAQFILAEIAGNGAGQLAGLAVRMLTPSPYALVLPVMICENAAFYSVLTMRGGIKLNDAKWFVCAEFLDVLLIRPTLLAWLPTLCGASTGLLAASLGADVCYYIVGLSLKSIMLASGSDLQLLNLRQTV